MSCHRCSERPKIVKMEVLHSARNGGGVPAASKCFCHRVLVVAACEYMDPDPAYRDTLEVSWSGRLSGDEERLEHLVHFWHLITGLKAARVG